MLPPVLFAGVAKNRVPLPMNVPSFGADVRLKAVGSQFTATFQLQRFVTLLMCNVTLNVSPTAIPDGKVTVAGRRLSVVEGAAFGLGIAAKDASARDSKIASTHSFLFILYSSI
jgi:hypothetical protein